MEITMQKITPFLWFEDQAEGAVKFYTSIFKNAKTGSISRYEESGAAASGRPEGSVMTASFSIEGQEFVILNGGPVFKLNPSVSFFLNFDPSKVKDARGEIDILWEKLSQEGSALMPLDKYPFSERYGWIQDKYGVSWQIVPTALGSLLGGPDPEKSRRTMKAMLQMKKLDIAKLQQA